MNREQEVKTKKMELIQHMHRAIQEFLHKNPEAEPEAIKKVGEVILENRFERIEKNKPVKLKISTRLLEKAEGSIREAMLLETQHNSIMDGRV